MFFGLIFFPCATFFDRHYFCLIRYLFHNTCIYYLSSGPRQLLLRNGENSNVFKRVNTACRQQMTTEKLFHKHFNQLKYYIFSNWYYISTELSSVTKPSITYRQIDRIFCRYSMAYRHALQIRYLL